MKEKEKDVDPEKDLLRENVPARDLLGERGNGHLGESDVLSHVTQFSFQSFQPPILIGKVLSDFSVDG